jgi:hypothetical protein
VDNETKRLENAGTPISILPNGVSHLANMAYPEDWTDPLHGYAYDSFNRDALLRLAKVRDGRIELPGGISYSLLVIPGKGKMTPNGDEMSPEVAACLLKLVNAGATIIVNERPNQTLGLQNYPESDVSLRQTISRLWDGKLIKVSGKNGNSIKMWKVGKGRVIQGPYKAESFDCIGIEPDVVVTDSSRHRAAKIAWNHRNDDGTDIYFISNQENKVRDLMISLRVDDKIPELFDPMTGEVTQAGEWQIKEGRTSIPLRFMPNGSMFIVLRKHTSKDENHKGNNWLETESVFTFDSPWQVQFNEKFGGPKNPVTYKSLQDWTNSNDPEIRFYSGTAVYTNKFNWKYKTDKNAQQRFWLDLGKLSAMAEVTVNGVPCGVAWTPPYMVELTKALKEGENQICIAVTNTWFNRLFRDEHLPVSERITWTKLPFSFDGKNLLPSGLLGPVQIMKVK